MSPSPSPSPSPSLADDLVLETLADDDQIDDEETQQETYIEDEQEEEEEEEEEETQDTAFDEDLPLETGEDQPPMDVDDENVGSRTMVQTKSTSKKSRTKDPVALTRLPSKSLLPVSRVQKIIKADKDIPIVAKDAVFLISLATEEFIKRIVVAGQRIASRENRATVQHKDLALVVRRIDEFVFLEEIMPWIAPVTVTKQTGKGKDKAAALKGKATALDEFVKPSKGPPSGTADQMDVDSDTAHNSDEDS